VTPSTVFVVDDDPSVRRALQRLIRSAGMTVQTFASAEEFLAARLPPPNCLVLDIRMHGMNGFELQQRLDPSYENVAVVFITAHDDELARQRAQVLKSFAFLHKPFEDDALLGVLSRAIALHGAHEQSNPPHD
jgi:FixJ family two-component response regulator